MKTGIVLFLCHSALISQESHGIVSNRNDERRSKTLETSFLIAICRLAGNQKLCFYLFLSRVHQYYYVFDCCLSSVGIFGIILHFRILPLFFFFA